MQICTKCSLPKYRMKNLAVSILFICSTIAYGQEDQEAKNPIGIGVRVGDFNGITAQYFITKARISFGLDVGRSYFLFGDDYQARFSNYAEEEGIEYVNYDPKETNEGPSLAFKFDICKYGNIGKVPHFCWYGGTGFQIRHFTLDHGYQVEKTALNSTQIRYDDVVIKDVSHISYGIDFILGSEYVFQEFPMSVFSDLTLFLEAGELSGQFMGQLGLGARVHF